MDAATRSRSHPLQWRPNLTFYQVVNHSMKTALLSLVALLACAFSASSATAGQRPHVVLMMADDLGWADVGFHGGKIKTPNIDKLAVSGVQ